MGGCELSKPVRLWAMAVVAVVAVVSPMALCWFRCVSIASYFAGGLIVQLLSQSLVPEPTMIVTVIKGSLHGRW